MPNQDQYVPESEANNTSQSQETTVKLTGITEIDTLLKRVTDIATQQKLYSYVYKNLIATPKLSTAKSQRAVYTVPGVGSKLEYVFSDSDIAWLARSLSGEGGADVSRDKASALAWTMFNRFMLNPAHPGWPNFWKFVQAFSQPVNPRWRRDGDFCRVGGKFYGKDPCSEKKLARRETIAFGAIPKHCLELSEEMAVGTLEQPSKIYIDFASYKGIEKWGDNVFGDYFLTAQMDTSRLAAQGKSPIKWFAGPVSRSGNRAVSPTDVIEPRKKQELIAYIASFVEGTERAVQNQVVNKATVNTNASVAAQTEVVHKRQQMANVAQATIAMQDVKVSTVSPGTGNGKDGFQVGSDDTWSKV